jgi:hypothetical protein
MSSVASTRSEVLEQLRQLGVETVTAEYDGAGDSGQIENPECGSVEVPHALTTAVQDLFYELLEQFYGGWEINEGSFGQFIWNVREDNINLVYNGRIETYSTEERRL